MKINEPKKHIIRKPNKSNKASLVLTIPFKTYVALKKFAKKYNYDLSSVADNYFSFWLEYKKGNPIATDDDIAQTFIQKCHQSKVLRSDFNINGKAVAGRKSRINITIDNQLIEMIKTNPMLRDINLSGLCNDYLWKICERLMDN